MVSYGSHARLPGYTLISLTNSEGETMIARTMRRILQYFQEGFYNQENNEEALKIYLIYTFSMVGFIFLLVLGLKGIHTSDTILTTFLLGAGALLMLNLFYLKVTNNYVMSGYVGLYLFFALMLYLIYSGGVENTGPLWIYSLPPIALYVHGLKRGLLTLSVFVFLITFILFYPDNNLLDTEYKNTFKVRIILSFVLVIFISAVYGYSREKSSQKMRKMRKDLEFFLRRDALTGLYNRRGYQDKIHSIKATHGAILMCDIDHFKRINDTYGHDVGDYTIQEVSKCIRNNLRKNDIAVRWGGEEFFVFLAETTLDSAYIVSEKLRESIENIAISYNENIEIHITMSIGISAVNDVTSLEDAIRNADNAMYKSKSSGRNKSIIY